MRRKRERSTFSTVPDASRACWRLTSMLGIGLLQPLLILASGLCGAAADDLTPLLAAPGTTVTLDSGTVYTVSDYCVAADKTILCNGARIMSTGGPICASGSDVRLVVDNCHIDGTGWALLAAMDGAQLVVQNDTQLTGNGANSAIYLAGSSLALTGGSIDQCMWGVNMENADAALHGVSVTHTPSGVLNVAGAVTVDDGSQLTNLDPANPGTGVGLLASTRYPSRAASAVIHDSKFTGFGNAVALHPAPAPGLPPGTAEIIGCTFDRAIVSALAAVDAEGVRFAGSRVTDAQTDGIFLVNSTAMIEDSQILNSLNSGVSFFGCPNGGTIRNSLVSGNAHQGVAVVADPDRNRVSHDIRIVDNTLKNNVIANVLVDDRSDAIIQGNIFSGAPDMSVRFHGSPAVRLIAGLLLDSHGGLEIKDRADASAALSVFTGHERNGTLVYANATARFSHCAFQANGRDPVAADYSVLAATGAQITLERCALGPANNRAFFNKTGKTATATDDYWDDPTGPRLRSGGGGNGAIVGWNAANGSRVKYKPFLTAPPLDVRVHHTFGLAADTATLWEPDIDLTLSLTGASGIVAVPAGLVAALRLRDAATLIAPAPPAGTFSDGVIAVWVEYDLLSRVTAGSLRLRTTGSGAVAGLSRLDPDGRWLPLSTAWDGAAGEIVYTPSDPRMLQGIFTFGDGIPAQQCATARECLQLLLTEPLCVDAIDPNLKKAIRRKLERALTKLTKAIDATTATKAVKFDEQARKALQAINTLTARSARLMKKAAGCRDAISDALRPALQRIDEGAL